MVCAVRPPPETFRCWLLIATMTLTGVSRSFATVTGTVPLWLVNVTKLSGSDAIRTRRIVACSWLSTSLRNFVATARSPRQPADSVRSNASSNARACGSPGVGRMAANVSARALRVRTSAR